MRAREKTAAVRLREFSVAVKRTEERIEVLSWISLPVVAIYGMCGSAAVGGPVVEKHYSDS